MGAAKRPGDGGHPVRVPAAADRLLQRCPRVGGTAAGGAGAGDGAPGALQCLDHPAVSAEVPGPGSFGRPALRVAGQGVDGTQ